MHARCHVWQNKFKFQLFHSSPYNIFLISSTCHAHSIFPSSAADLAAADDLKAHSSGGNKEHAILTAPAAADANLSPLFIAICSHAMAEHKCSCIASKDNPPSNPLRFASIAFLGR